jgi:hypothetical protein
MFMTRNSPWVAQFQYPRYLKGAWLDLQNHTQLKQMVIGITPKLMSFRKIFTNMLFRFRLNMANREDKSPNPRIPEKLRR